MKNLLFYYPQHFNRSENGSNPFFDRLLAVCDRHGISYDLMEEPDLGTDKPRNGKAIKADSFFWAVTIIRKIISMIFYKNDFYQNEKIVAKLFNVLTIGKFRYRRYVTISGSMYHFLSYLNSKAIVYDLQHGVVYHGQQTFFEDDGHLRAAYKQKNLRFLFWGDGYKQTFILGNEDSLNDRIKVIGYPLIQKQKVAPIKDKKKTLLVSLQFIDDITQDSRQREKDMLILKDFLVKIKDAGYNVLLKHHPRYNNIISIDELLKFDYVSLTNDSFEELVKRTKLHVTFFSTATFEYAEYGVPTYFLPNDGKRAGDRLFYEQYHYPLYYGMDINQVLDRIENGGQYLSDCAVIEKWYSKFYSPFDEEAFLELIN